MVWVTCPTPSAWRSFTVFTQWCSCFSTLAVSAALPNSKPVLVAMCGFWAVTVFVVPRLAADVSRIAYPLPAAVTVDKAIEADLQNGLDGRSPDAVVGQRREQTLELYGAERVEDLPINFQGIVFSIQEQLGNAVFDLHYGELNQTLDAQQGVHELLGLISPVLPVKLISMELSGTSLHHQATYTQHAEDYRREFIEQMNQAITLNSKPGEAEYRAGPDLWAAVEPYRYDPPGFLTSLSTLGPQPDDPVSVAAGGGYRCCAGDPPAEGDGGLMFFRVLADEWVFLRTSHMWWAALATLSVITIVAAFVGSARVQQLDELGGGLNADEVMLQQTLKAGVERYEANPSGDPPSTMNAGALGLSLLAHYAVKPSTALAPLAVGQSDLAPRLLPGNGPCRLYLSQPDRNCQRPEPGRRQLRRGLCADFRAAYFHRGADV